MKAQIVIKFPNSAGFEELKEKYMNQKLAVTLFGKEGAIKVEGEMKPLDEGGGEKEKLIDKEKLVEFLDNYPIDRETTVMDLYRDTLQAIQNMEVEAIPIEWLLSKKYEIVTDTEAFPVNYVIDKVVDLWRKENGSK